MTAELMTLVIPVYNERDSLAPLLAEIAAVAKTLPTAVEVVFVDDGSTDDSWQVVKTLAEGDDRVRGLRFRANFGKAAALQAGFTAARGQVVFTLDADLQDDPAEVPRFLDALAAGKDVVSGWKQVRHDPWHKVFPSRVFNSLVSRVTGVKLHDHNCGFKAYRGEVLKELRLYGELHRFVPVLAAARGFRVGELVVHHRARKFGRSKFGWQRFVKGFLDLVGVRFTTAYGHRPLHALGTLALVLGALAGLAAGLAVLAWLVYWSGQLQKPWHGFWSALALGSGGLSAVLGVLAGQALFAGLVAELLVAKTAPTATPYAVTETVR